MDFGQPNAEIGRKMANGRQLFLALLEMLRDHNSVKICDLVCDFLVLWAP